MTRAGIARPKLDTGLSLNDRAPAYVSVMAISFHFHG